MPSLVDAKNTASNICQETAILNVQTFIYVVLWYYISATLLFGEMYLGLRVHRIVFASQLQPSQPEN